MNTFLNDVYETLSSFFYLIRAGIAAITASPVLLAGSIVLLLTAGKTFKLGKVLEFKSK